MKTLKRIKWAILLAMAAMVGTFSASGQTENQDLGPRYGEDSATCVMNISLYREFFKQWRSSNYQSNTVLDAFRPWRWVILNYPRGTQNAYIDGPKIMEYMINNAENTALREKYIDTLMMVYDQRIKYFGNEGFVLGRKGVDLFQYRPSAAKDVYNILKRSIEIEGMESPSAVLVYYFRAAVTMVEKGEAEKSLVMDTYNDISDILDWNAVNHPERAENYESARNNIELAFQPYASCEDLIAVFTDKMKANPNDPVLLKKIGTMMERKGCTDSDLYFEASVQLYEIEPSPESAFQIGKMYYKRENYGKSAQYLVQAEGMSNQNTVADAMLLLANAYFNMKQYQNARSAAQKALKAKPEDGRPYMLIGDLYAASASECGDNKLTVRVAFWAAVDKYYQAKSTDPSLEAEANAKINTYSAYFPPAADIFFYELTEGQSYTVGCWINETTRVRALK